MLPLAPAAPPEVSAAAVSRIGLVPTSLKPGFRGFGAAAGRGVAAAAVGRAVLTGALVAAALTGALVAAGAGATSSAAVGAAVGASV
eukprot:8223-Heterococcus_DN1.PRE.1